MDSGQEQVNQVGFAARMIAELTGLDVFYRVAPGWEHIRSSQTPEGLVDALDPIAIATRFSHGDAPPTVTRDEYGISWIGGTVRSVPIVVGPFLLTPPTATGTRFLQQFAGFPPSRSEEEIQGIADAFLLADTAGDAGEQVRPAHADISGIHNPAMDDVHQMDLEGITGRYEYEQRIRDAVARGDRKALSAAIGDGFETRPFYHRMPGNPVRTEKNLTFVLNTILRLSAEAGGLVPIHLHGISDEFALRIEQARRVEEFPPLRTEMMYRYCDAVREFAVTRHSAPVRAVTRYILSNLDTELTIPDLAARAGCSPSYLSRLFRREQGVSVGTFIREKRIAEARWLLANTDQPTAEIADATGFSDLNYFRRVFRAETGTTPGAYRRKYRHRR